MVQTEMAAEAIKKVFPSIEIEIAGFETKGDLHLDKSLSAFGSKGAFTKELGDSDVGRKNRSGGAQRQGSAC